MSPVQVAALIDAIDASDPERAHGTADDLLLDAVPGEIREAYIRLCGRCRWWACA